MCITLLKPILSMRSRATRPITLQPTRAVPFNCRVAKAKPEAAVLHHRQCSRVYPARYRALAESENGRLHPRFHFSGPRWYEIAIDYTWLHAEQWDRIDIGRLVAYKPSGSP